MPVFVNEIHNKNFVADSFISVTGPGPFYRNGSTQVLTKEDVFYGIRMVHVVLSPP